MPAFFFAAGRAGFVGKGAAVFSFGAGGGSGAEMGGTTSPSSKQSKGMGLVEKHLEPPPFLIDGFGFCRWIPDRPRYMHQTTYRRYLRRFAKYQDQYQRRQLEDMARLLRLFK